MSITFIGNEIPETERILTGFNGLDRALAGGDKRGFPIRTLAEIFGPAGVGKSTVMLSLGAIFAVQLGGRIDLADLEGQSHDTVINSLLMQGYEGELNLLRDKNTKTHVDILDNMVADFATNKCNVALLDSAGAFVPPGELEGSIADSNMGKKPFMIGNWTRAMVNILMNKRGVAMYVSHQHPNIGFVGNHTSGGWTKGFMNALQIELKRKDVYDDGWLVEGTVRKNRYGRKDNTFVLFLIGGQGMHSGLTAAFECVTSGLASIERKSLTMNGKSYGKIATLIRNWKDDELFAAFKNEIISAHPEHTDDEDVVDETSEVVEEGLQTAAAILKKVEKKPRRKSTKKK